MKTRRARHLRVVEPEPAPADLPWAKIYVGDYWRLTRGWPIEARGVLVELMLSQWAMGRLPTEPSRLRALVNVPGAVWKRTWLMVAPLCTSSAESGPFGVLSKAHSRPSFTLPADSSASAAPASPA